MIKETIEKEDLIKNIEDELHRYDDCANISLKKSSIYKKLKTAKTECNWDWDEVVQYGGNLDKICINFLKSIIDEMKVKYDLI